ncbi:MAG: AsmA-like C-terminal region-containing protein [Bacteroidia bacterium]
MKLLKRLLLAFALIFVLFFSAAFIITAFYGDNIKSLLVTELNEQLIVKVEVKDIQLSFIRNFPFASVEFTAVRIEEATDAKLKNSLVEAARISFVFNIINIFRENYSVRKLIIKDGHVNVYIDEQGNENFVIWKTGTDTTKSDFEFEIEKLELINVKLSYVNLKTNHTLLTDGSLGIIGGKFSSDNYVMSINTDMFLHQFAANDVKYLSDKATKLDVQLSINKPAGEYIFERSKINLADLIFSIEGKVIDGEKGIYTDLKIDASEAPLSGFLSVLPPQYAEHFRKYKSKGFVSFYSTMKGSFENNNTPDVSVEFKVRNGFLKPEKSPVALEHLDLRGTYANKPERLQIIAFTGDIAGRKIEGNVRVDDFKNPLLSFETQASFDLNYLQHFLSIDTLKEMHGELFVNTSFKGYLKQIPKKDFSELGKISASGEMTVNNGSFKLKNNPLDFKNFNGTVRFRNSDMEVSNFRGEISNSDFALTGICKNLLLFILSPDQHSKIEASLVSNNIDLNQLLQNKKTIEADTSYYLSFSPRLDCDLSVFIDDLAFRKFNASNIKGNILLKKQVLSASVLSFNAMDGSVNIRGDIDASKGRNITMKCDADIRQIDIHKLFFQMENFGQLTMRDKNLKGHVTADIHFSSVWSRDLVADMDKVYVKSNVKIENGELIDFEPMLALSRYIKVSELKQIKFSTLQNSIEIKKQMIYIPQMEIKSNALNLTASGIHSFDNNIDYQMQLLLSEILGKKVREQKSEFGRVEDDGLGRMTLFLAMKGKADDPKFYYDTKGVSNKIASEIKQEKKTVKGILKEELGLFKKDTSVVAASARDKKKKDVIEVDYGDNSSTNEEEPASMNEERKKPFRNIFKKQGNN